MFNPETRRVLVNTGWTIWLGGNAAWRAEAGLIVRVWFTGRWSVGLEGQIDSFIERKEATVSDALAEAKRMVEDMRDLWSPDMTWETLENMAAEFYDKRHRRLAHRAESK